MEGHYRLFESLKLLFADDNFGKATITDIYVDNVDYFRIQKNSHKNLCRAGYFQ